MLKTLWNLFNHKIIPFNNYSSIQSDIILIPWTNDAFPCHHNVRFSTIIRVLNFYHAYLSNREGLWDSPHINEIKMMRRIWWQVSPRQILRSPSTKRLTSVEYDHCLRKPNPTAIISSLHHQVTSSWTSSYIILQTSTHQQPPTSLIINDNIFTHSTSCTCLHLLWQQW